MLAFIWRAASRKLVLLGTSRELSNALALRSYASGSSPVPKAAFTWSRLCSPLVFLSCSRVIGSYLKSMKETMNGREKESPPSSCAIRWKDVVRSEILLFM